MKKYVVLMLAMLMVNAPFAGAAVPDPTNTTVVPEDTSGTPDVSGAIVSDNSKNSKSSVAAPKDYRMACAIYTDSPTLKKCRDLKDNPAQ